MITNSCDYEWWWWWCMVRCMPGGGEMMLWAYSRMHTMMWCDASMLYTLGFLHLYCRQTTCSYYCCCCVVVVVVVAYFLLYVVSVCYLLYVFVKIIAIAHVIILSTITCNDSNSSLSKINKEITRKTLRFPFKTLLKLKLNLQYVHNYTVQYSTVV